MTAIQRLIKALQPLSLYSLKIYTSVYKELESYSVALDVLDEIMDEYIREGFIDTANDYGLSLYEKLYGAERTDLTLEQRREMLIQRINLNVNDNTLSGIKRFFSSLGLKCEIRENPHIFDLYILPLTGEYTSLEQEYIIEKARDFLPCHLTFTIDFRSIDWHGLQQLDLTFAEIDAKQMSWNDFEKYSGG